MKLLVQLFIFIGLVSLVVGFIEKFFMITVLFPNIKPLSHLVFANSCMLIALVLKIAND